MKTELANLVNYSAKRILDQFLTSYGTMSANRQFLAEEMFKDLKKGETYNIIFNNLDAFNTELNQVIWKRIDYLVAEGFVERTKDIFHVRTEEEIEEFVNSVYEQPTQSEDEEGFPF